MPQFLAVFGIAAIVALVIATLVASAIGRLGFPLPPGDRRLGSVDGLRGYLALAVMVHHFFIWIQVSRLGGAWIAPSVDFLNQLGTGSVGLFFMTTGFVFYPRVLAGFRGTFWPSVLVSRVFRILPLVVVSVGLVTAIIMARTGALPDLSYITAAARWVTSWSAPPLLGYPDSGRVNAYVLWSLWYEWLFYLFILPACACAMDIARARRLPTWSVAAVLFAIGAAAHLDARLMTIFTGVLLYVPLFAVGMLAYELQSRASVRRVLSTPAAAAVAIAALLIGMMATTTPYARSLPLFAVFFICVACGNHLAGALRGRGALVLGECSFGIYLLHGILLDVLFVEGNVLHASWGVNSLPMLLPVTAGAIVMLTAITYLGIERPAIQAGKSLSGLLSRRRLALDSREIEVAP